MNPDHALFISIMGSIRAHRGDQRLLALARRIIPWQVATSKRSPKIEKPKGWVAVAKAPAHVSTARVLKAAAEQRP